MRVECEEIEDYGNVGTNVLAFAKTVMKELLSSEAESRSSCEMFQVSRFSPCGFLSSIELLPFGPLWRVFWMKLQNVSSRSNMSR